MKLTTISLIHCIGSVLCSETSRFQHENNKIKNKLFAITFIVHYSISQAMDSENEERIKQLMYEKYHLKTKLVSFHGNPSSSAIIVEFC